MAEAGAALPRTRSQAAGLRAMSWLDRALLVEVVLLLFGAGALLKLFTFNRLYGILARLTRTGHASASPARAERIARIVGMASRHAPFSGACLQRSLVLWWLLRRRGVPGAIRFGARRADGAFRAHAWVELDGEPLGDDDRRAASEYVRMPWLPADRGV